MTNWSAITASTATHMPSSVSWECWDADAVTNGAVKGSTLAMLRERLGAEFLGDLDPTQIFRSSPRSSPRTTGQRRDRARATFRELVEARDPRCAI